MGAVVVVGAPNPPALEMEAAAAAIRGAPGEAVPRGRDGRPAMVVSPLQPAGIAVQRADRTDSIPSVRARHPDPLADEIRWQISEARRS